MKVWADSFPCCCKWVEAFVSDGGMDTLVDQLVCPVLSCKKWIAAVDIKRITGDALLQQFQVTLKRKRVRRGHAEALLCFNVTVMVHRRSYVAQDERNPSARWCPRPGCEELIICESMADFTCPKCKTVGCFQCRGFAHRFWFCQVKEDESYLEWERSVGNRQAVRPCPQCHMRIWKAEGCVRLLCTTVYAPRRKTSDQDS